MKFKIKFVDQIVGLFVLLALLFFVAIIILVGANQRWFAKDIKFITEFPSASGVTPGTGIMMKGFTVGKIDKIRLNDKNTVDADFHIFEEYYHLVKKFSILELTVSPIGLGSSLLFHPGLGDEMLEEGTFIPTADSVDGQTIIEQELVNIPSKDDTITNILANVNPLLENVNKVVITVNRTLTEVNRALAGQSSGPLGNIINDASGVVDSLKGTANNVDLLVSSLPEQVNNIMVRVNSLLEEAQVIVENLEQTSAAIKDPTGLVPKLLDPKGSIKTILNDNDALYKRLMSIISEVDKSMKNVQNIISSLNSEVPKIATVLNETRSAIEKAQDVLEGVKNNPLIRGGITEKAEQDSVYQGIREGDF